MNVRQIIVVLVSAVAAAMGFGQDTQGLSIVNYQIVSQSPGQFRNNVTYRADLVNSGAPLGAVSATATSLNLPSFTVAPGQDKLTFSPVPPNGQTTSSNTITLLVNPAIPFDLANLQWTFEVTPVPPIANAGSNQAATLGSTVILDGSGSTNPSGTGTISYRWDFTSRPVGSAAVLTNPTSVRPSFVLDVPGDYVIKLTVSNSGGSSSANVTVSTVYTPPVANAGPDQKAFVGTVVILNGGASTSVNGKPLSYSWTLVTQPPDSTTVLTLATTVSPSFVVDKPGVYVAQLVVNDTVSNSSPANVIITTINSPPVANAGRNQLVTTGAIAQLNGSGSTDVDGDPLTYKWSFLSVPDGSKATLSDPSIVNPIFTIDVAGTYVVQLIVNDGNVDSKPATLFLTTDTVLPPIADPGPNQTVLHRTPVILNGSGSTDPQQLPLTFLWALLSRPSGSTATLSGVNIASPTFFADLPGTYIAQLIVRNMYLDSPPATVTIATTNTPPVASAGPNQNVMVGANVTLDGSGSFDADHDALTYSWSLLSRPNASKATLVATNTASPMFDADVPGTYVAQLIVNDGFTSSVPATVAVTAVQTVKLTLTPNPLNMSTAAPATLTLTLAAPAGSGGQIVNLKSFGPDVASVPANVTVPENATAVNFTITPGAAGSTAIYASASGFLTASAIVNVIDASITLKTEFVSFGPTRTTKGTISLSTSAPAGGVVVSLSASPAGIVTVDPPSVTIPAGESTGAFTVTGVDLGAASITGSAPGFTSGVVSVRIVLVGFISLPPAISVELGQKLPFPVTLVTPAPLGGVTINLASNNPSKVTIAPSTVFIDFKAMTPAVQPTVTGLSIGTANISAFAPGFAVADPTQVQVSATLSFVPSTLVISSTGSGVFSLVLSGPAPASGLTVRLSSDNTAIAIVPPIVTFKPFTTTANVSVRGGATGSTVIRAKSTGISDAIAKVVVN